MVTGIFTSEKYKSILHYFHCSQQILLEWPRLSQFTSTSPLQIYEIMSDAKSANFYWAFKIIHVWQLFHLVKWKTYALFVALPPHEISMLFISLDEIHVIFITKYLLIFSCLRLDKELPSNRFWFPNTGFGLLNASRLIWMKQWRTNNLCLVPQGLPQPFFGKENVAHGIGKISSVSTKIGKKNYCFYVWSFHLIPIVNLTLFLDII